MDKKQDDQSSKTLWSSAISSSTSYSEAYVDEKRKNLTNRRRQNNSLSTRDQPSTSTFDVKLQKKILNSSRTISETSKDSVRHDILNLVKHEAEVEDLVKGVGDSDPEEELHCCLWWRNRSKNKSKRRVTKLPETTEEPPPIVIEPEETKDNEEIWMQRLQIIAKWAVVLIGIFDFCQSLQETYTVLRRLMKYEYFYLQRVYNCDHLMLGGYRLVMFAHVLHGIMSVSLLFIHNKENCGFAMYWIFSQIFLLLILVAAAIFKTRYTPDPIVNLGKEIWRLILNLVQLFIVMFRFYKLFNPFTGRLHEYASAKQLDRTINHELKLRSSNFIKRKAAVREAANVQTLALIVKLHKVSMQTGQRPEPSVVQVQVAHKIRKVHNKTHDYQKSESEINVRQDSSISQSITSQGNLKNNFRHQSDSKV